MSTKGALAVIFEKFDRKMPWIKFELKFFTFIIVDCHVFQFQSRDGNVFYENPPRSWSDIHILIVTIMTICAKLPQLYGLWLQNFKYTRWVQPNRSIIHIPLEASRNDHMLCSWWSWWPDISIYSGNVVATVTGNSLLAGVIIDIQIATWRYYTIGS